MNTTTETTPVTRETLKGFCGENDRYDMSEPFVRDGKMYATDTALAIRIDAEGWPDDDAVGLPPMDELPWPDGLTPTDHDWPAAVYRFVEEWVKCDECDAEESTLAWFPSHDGQRIDGRVVSTRYHHKVTSLPNVKYHSDGKADAPLRFRFDGGEGVLMPLNPKFASQEPEEVCG